MPGKLENIKKINQQKGLRETLLYRLFEEASYIPNKKVDAQQAAQSMKCDPETIRVLAERLYEEGFVGGLGPGGSPDRRQRLPCHVTHDGAKWLEWLSLPRHAKFWAEFKHSIVAGLLGIVGSLLGVIIGNFL